MSPTKVLTINPEFFSNKHNNSKTLKIEEYKKFIINKNKLNNNVKTFYNNILLRKLNFRRFWILFKKKIACISTVL